MDTRPNLPGFPGKLGFIFCRYTALIRIAETLTFGQN